MISYNVITIDINNDITIIILAIKVRLIEDFYNKNRR